MARLEHANITVSDLDATADRLCELFGWRRRWRERLFTAVARSMWAARTITSRSIRGGDEGGAPKAPDSYGHVGALNHIGVVVDDLDEAERKVVSIGLTPHSHANYEPGRRFYSMIPTGSSLRSYSTID